MAGCLESSTPENAEGTGGSLTSGGEGGGSAGERGNPNCDPTVPGAGGALYLFECPEWLGTSEWPYDGAVLPLSCGGESADGHGGQTGEPPALRRLCEAESNPFLNNVRPILECLQPLVDNACAANHEEDVRSCLTRLPPCIPDATSSVCADLQEACPSLLPDTCWWGMRAARDTDFVTTCLDEVRPGESCKDRFLRCAWGL